jgi:hypothetical protein
LHVFFYHPCIIFVWFSHCFPIPHCLLVSLVLPKLGPWTKKRLSWN